MKTYEQDLDVYAFAKLNLYITSIVDSRDYFLSYFMNRFPNF